MPEWWRSAVIYQVYPRSFADGSGDGVGDLPGVIARLPQIASLGVDAVWLSPFYPSPQRDGGYDISDFFGVDPLFGTLADAERLIEVAHDLHLRVIVDIVPNHSSAEHPWFQAALAAGPGSPERGRYVFRDGRGAHGEEPPNNWSSRFGGPAWTQVPDGQWYLHAFDASQPDFDWDSPDVVRHFDDVLRWWLDRGVDGFRIDVAHGSVKPRGLPDVDLATWAPGPMTAPYFDVDGVHEIYRRWRPLVDAYPGDRMLCGEAWVQPLNRLARYVRPDELHQAFNFAYLQCGWDADELRTVIDDSLAEFGAVGAPSTWVLSNHDTIRHTTRLALRQRPAHGQGIGPEWPDQPDPVVSRLRGRAAMLLMLALPGSAYLYQGDELGLPEVIDLPVEARQDPTLQRSGGAYLGRDGARVPIPWEADAPAYGFSATGASWLPQPDDWAGLARDVQESTADSTLRLTREALALRRTHGLGEGEVRWLPAESGVLLFRNRALLIAANTSDRPVPLPPGRVLIASGPLDGAGAGAGERMLPPDTTVWMTPAGP